MAHGEGRTGREEVSSWGMVLSARSEVRRPRDVTELAGVLEEARRSGRQVGLRGSGLSYGDAALATDALLLESGAMNRLLSWDAETGVLRLDRYLPQADEGASEGAEERAE